MLPKKKKLVKVKGNKINKRKQKFNPKKKENKNGLRNHWQHSKKFDGCKHSHLEFGNFHRCLFTLASKIKPLFHSLSFQFHCSPLCFDSKTTTTTTKTQNSGPQKLHTHSQMGLLQMGFWVFCCFLNWVFVFLEKYISIPCWVFALENLCCKKMMSYKQFWTKKTLIGLGLGQFLSLLITSTGFTSSELAKRGILMMPLCMYVCVLHLVFSCLKHEAILLFDCNGFLYFQFIAMVLMFIMTGPTQSNLNK